MLTKTQVAVVNIPSGVKPLSVDVGVQCEQLSLIDAGVQCQPAQLPDYVLSSSESEVESALNTSFYTFNEESDDT